MCSTLDRVARYFEDIPSGDTCNVIKLLASIVSIGNEGYNIPIQPRSDGRINLGLRVTHGNIHP
jgi:hypothetical protein